MNDFYFGKHYDLDELINNYETQASIGKPTDLDIPSYLNLIGYFESEDTARKALEVAEMAIRLHKYSSELHVKRAQLLLSLKNNELALESLDRAEIFGHPFVEVELMRVSAHTRLKRFEQAKDLILQLRRDYAVSRQELSQSFVLESDIYYQQGVYYQMYLALKSALIESPNNQQALKSIWLAMELSHQYDDCIAFHHELLEADAYEHLSWYNLGHAYYNKLAYNEALEAFDFCMTIDEHFLPAYEDYIETAMQQQKFYLAIHCLEKARISFDYDEKMLLKMGICRHAIHHYGSARNYLFRALKLDNMNPEIYFYLGQCYVADERYQDALYYLKKAVSLQDDHEDYQLALANLFGKLEQPQKAIHHFRKATDLAAHLTRLWVDYAVYFLEQGELTAAIETVEEAEDFTYGADLYYVRAAIEYLNGNEKAYINHLEEAFSEEVDQREIFFNLVPRSARNNAKIRGMLRYFIG